MGPYKWRGARSRRDRRAISGQIATIILLAITIILVAILATFQFNLNQPLPKVWYIVQGNQTEQAWGDPTDCSNTSQFAHCNSLPAAFVTVTGFSPSYISLNNLFLSFMCNGTMLLNGSLTSLEVVPGTGASPPAGAPQIQNCGTWSWGTGNGYTGTYFNRLLYYQQVTPGVPGVRQGDMLVIYSHPHNNFCDYSGYCPDDDYHGAPLWCFAVQNACTIYVTYQSGAASELVMSFSLFQLGGGT